MRARVTRREHGHGGFTLLETACVLLVLGLAASVVAARLGARPAARLEAAAAQLAERATAARWHALLAGRVVRLRLRDEPGLSVTTAPTTTPVELRFRPLPEATARTITLRDTRGRRAVVRIPPGLQPITVAMEAPS